MKQFQTVTKEINGKKYTAQFNGIGAALRATDMSYIDGSSNMSMEKMTEYLLENVIVEPKGLEPDSFESMDEFNKVIAFATKVMRGDFREEKNKNGNKGTDKQ